MSPQCSGVGVPGATNVVDLCKRCNRGLNMMLGEACVHFIALSIHFLRHTRPRPRIKRGSIEVLKCRLNAAAWGSQVR
jgi:hypothetical protein